MFSALKLRLARLGLAAAGVLALFGLSGSHHASAAGDVDWPSHVSALYSISFNGFDLGRFAFQADVRAKSYTLSGDAEISALLGFVKWQGLTRTAGHISGAKALPSGYAFDFSSSGKSGSVSMSFRNGAVRSALASPPLPTTPDMVPVERSQLKGVLDPLTAVMVMTRPAGDNPCNQRLPIYDGLQRFDLIATPAGTRQLSGQQGILHVCEMRYRPISGYKRGSETEELARSLKIEIAMLPVPNAGLYVPHEIKIPTLVGSAVLKLQKIDIVTSNQDQIAFVN
ncbi:MAG TPA: DUF3108 domain-containing protein [Hyphomicrobiaceae bacterium]|nr:DUF3108 domain-containing protein [Hyphomicrobiaceae bacterium]